MPTDEALCDAAAKRWTEHMLRGNFQSAWRESDFIASTGRNDPHRFWKGESWAAKRVMLRCLHGLGDAIQFIRYAPLLKEACRTLTVQSHPELVRLLNCVPAVDRAVTWGEAEDEWDVQMEVTELPRIFRTELDTIPARAPYIFIPQAAKEWAASLIKGPHSLRVGLIWRASNWDESRSLSAADIRPLLGTPGCSFYVLQKNADRRIDAHDLQSHADDVADTAALMCGLDLIISVDTMTAHLAGALGKRTWVLLPATPDWRWMSNRSDSPWYPGMSLFRQNKPGDWQDTVAAVAGALSRMAASAQGVFTAGA